MTQTTSASPDLTGNPLAEPSPLPYQLPDYAAIRVEHLAPALAAGIAEQRALLEAVATDTSEPTVGSVLAPLVDGSPLLRRAASVFFDLVSADGTEELHRIEAEVMPELTALDDAAALDPRIFARVEALAAAVERGEVSLSAEQAHLLDLLRQDFVLHGANLSEAESEQLSALNQDISAAQTLFSQAVTTDMKQAAVHVTDEDELAGLDASQRATARAAAAEAGLEGWLLTLILPTVQPLLASLERRDVRERLHRASLERGTRTWELAAQIAALRARKARLLGFADFASLAVADRTARTPEAVEELFAQAAEPAMRNADAEAARIARRAAADGITDLAAWDWPFYAEKIRAEEYAVDAAELRPYLVLDRVLEDGVFAAATAEYGITFTRREDLRAHHPEARVWEVRDADGSELGLFIGDFFTRDTKRGGAWMNSLMDQSHRDQTLPVVRNTLNISRPAEGEPAFVTLDEVRTLFHEFGHALHGLLSDVEHVAASGTSVPRDVVEYPSQVNEQWILTPDVMERYARHVETDEPLSAEVRQRIADAALWGEGQGTVEYLAAAVLDWQWHRGDGTEPVTDPHAHEQEILERAGLAHPLVAPRYRTGYFNHTFSGGYASGYYSYLWAEAFDADTVAWFGEQERAGRARREAGEDFRRGILGIGGSRDLLEAYRDFRGADRDVRHLLVRRGLVDPE